MRDKVDIPGNLRRVARYLRAVEVIVPGAHNRRNLSTCASWLEQVANHVHRQETHMGRVNDQIQKLESALSTERTRANHLQAQLDAQQANVLDSADLAALDGVDAAIAGDTGGTDTTGGAGGDTVAGGANP